MTEQENQYQELDKAWQELKDEILKSLAPYVEPMLKFLSKYFK